MKRFLSLFIVLSMLMPMMASAESEPLNIAGKRAKLVGKAAAYGAGGGLVVGLASQVFKKKAKNIFLFGSLGLYAGILVGIYVVSTTRGPSNYDGPDTYEDYGDFSLRSRNIAPTASGMLAQEVKFAGDDAVQMPLMQLKF